MFIEEMRTNPHYYEHRNELGNTNNVDVILTLSYGDDDGTILGDSG